MTREPTPHQLTAAALACARRGWHVFPVRPGDKRPALRADWEGRATTDPDRIRRCWTHAPYNIGIACGPSGLVVIDLDTPKPGERPPREWAMPGVNEGADVLAVLCERHAQPWPADTFTVTTRRGGIHLYFTAPAGPALRNTQSGTPRALGWRIDTRAHGGYVVAPGSYVAQDDGAGPYEVIHDTTPAVLPEWLTGLLNDAHHPSPAMQGSTYDPALVTDLSAYGKAALHSGAERVATAANGGRNHALYDAAHQLGQLVGAEVLPADTVATVLFQAASVHFGPTRDDMNPTEARNTIRSGLTTGIRRPRVLTQRGAA